MERWSPPPLPTWLYLSLSPLPSFSLPDPPCLTPVCPGSPESREPSLLMIRNEKHNAFSVLGGSSTHKMHTHTHKGREIEWNMLLLLRLCFFSFHISIWLSQENPPHQGRSNPDRQQTGEETQKQTDTKGLWRSWPFRPAIETRRLLGCERRLNWTRSSVLFIRSHSEIADSFPSFLNHAESVGDPQWALSGA